MDIVYIRDLLNEIAASDDSSVEMQPYWFNKFRHLEQQGKIPSWLYSIKDIDSTTFVVGDRIDFAFLGFMSDRYHISFSQKDDQIRIIGIGIFWQDTPDPRFIEDRVDDLIDQVERKFSRIFGRPIDDLKIELIGKSGVLFLSEKITAMLNETFANIDLNMFVKWITR